MSEDTIAADLEWLSRNTVSVSVSFNEPRLSYATVAKELEPTDWGHRYELAEFGSEETQQACIDQDRLISVQFYPQTPVGCYILHGVDLAEVLARARKVMEGELSHGAV